MTDDLIKDGDWRFLADAVRRDERANPGVVGEGTALELLQRRRGFRRWSRHCSLPHVPRRRSLQQVLLKAAGIVVGPDLAFARDAQPASAAF